MVTRMLPPGCSRDVLLFPGQCGTRPAGLGERGIWGGRAAGVPWLLSPIYCPLLSLIVPSGRRHPPRRAAEAGKPLWAGGHGNGRHKTVTGPFSLTLIPRAEEKLHGAAAQACVTPTDRFLWD